MITAQLPDAGGVAKLRTFMAVLVQLTVSGVVLESIGMAPIAQVGPLESRLRTPDSVEIE